MENYVLLIVGGVVGLFLIFLFIVASFYKKIPQGKSIVRTGFGGTKVAFNKGMYVVPVIHKMEIMDISLKKVQIERMENDGLICKDNIRADIKVAFFVRVNKSVNDVINVAQSIGTSRASDISTLKDIFEAKFSEALKTVGKKFDFIELYEARREFRDEIIDVIGTDLNGYVLDDCAIDYLEQTELKFLSSENILDSEGIKKITDLTAAQNIKANLIRREEEKVIRKQNVEAREAILELDRQLAEKEEKQRREIDNVKAREEAEIQKVREEERLKSETVRISTEESLAVQEENKLRQIIIAEKNKQRTEAVEAERVEKDRALEQTERERIVTLAQIEKTRVVEIENKNIQDVIRERVQLEKGVVEEKQNMQDIEAFRTIDRQKQVGITEASQLAEERLIQTVKEAEARKLAAEEKAKELLIDAEAQKEASAKQAEARKILADAKAREDATYGLAEAEVIKAKAEALEQQGIAEAIVIEKKADAKKKEGLAEAEVSREKALATAEGESTIIEKTSKAEAIGIEAKAEAKRKEGLVEAEITKEKALATAEGESSIIEKTSKAEAVGIEVRAEAKRKEGFVEAEVAKEKALAEAAGIEEKAEAMKKLDGVGREHEEFKLALQKEKDIELAQIDVQKNIAEAQAHVLAEALKSADIDIVGGETMFFENIVKQISNAKGFDRLVNESTNATQIKKALLGDGENEGDLLDRIRYFAEKSGISTDDIKNLSIAGLILKMQSQTSDKEDKSFLSNLMGMAKAMGISNKKLN
ncbi:flotillin family protein [Dysgonomonas sp. 511]|uniref:flotillin family protein n=1 Tax=Dysgonomonas sp. 511 TaxID=2302930 RepID=UPI0013D46DB0|nr:flotillin family protein [Dysgonomonas sp. 511]NDV78231.1 flotillin family protein [Dysgonomonas sp. 511]